MTHIEEFKLAEKAQKGMSGKIAFGVLKEEMWRETVRFLEQWTEDSIETHAKEIQRKKDMAKRESRVQNWEKSKAKL